MLAVAACIFFAPACGRKNKRIANVPASPQPSIPSSPSTTTARRQQPKPATVPIGYVEEGAASWYGIPYHGRHAADGEIYDMETLVAAHRVLPFNTWLKVTNLSNRKSVNVRIIDRGPFVDGRIIDLSKAAARQIDLIGPGVGSVRLEVIAAPADIPADDFYAVQVGAFTVRENAERARASYEERYGAAKVTVKQGRITMWLVLVGKEPSIEAAQKLAASLSVENKDVFVVRLDEVLPTPLPTPPPAVAKAAIWQTPDNITFDPASGITTAQPQPGVKPPQE